MKKLILALLILGTVAAAGRCLQAEDCCNEDDIEALDELHQDDDGGDDY